MSGAFTPEMDEVSVRLARARDVQGAGKIFGYATFLNGIATFCITRSLLNGIAYHQWCASVQQ